MNIKQLKIISNNFIQELLGAKNGKKTSLPFIVHELSPSPLVRDGEVFQSIVIGGTVAKIATLKKNGKTIQILNKKEEKLSFKTEEEFLDYINKELPENINILALNFAHALKPILKMEDWTEFYLA